MSGLFHFVRLSVIQMKKVQSKKAGRQWWRDPEGGRGGGRGCCAGRL